MDHETDTKHELQALLKFLYIAPVGLIQASLDGAIHMINPVAANLLMPLQPDGNLENLFAIIAPALPEIEELVASHDDISGRICDELRFRPFPRARRSAECRTYEMTLLKIDAKTLMAVLNDVTETVKREEIIRLGATWHDSLLNERFAHGVLDLDEDGAILSWNSALEGLIGHIKDDVIGKSCKILFAKTSNFEQRLPDLLYDASQSGWAMQNGWCTRASGEDFWANFIITVAQPYKQTSCDGSEREENQRFCMLIRNIHQHADASSQIAHAIKLDFLTGLLNRRAFFDAAEMEIKRWLRYPRPLCLLSIDADHFKSINDRFGHGVGDVVLKALADAIRCSLRETDITARIGGEEFVVLLPYTDTADANELALRIRDRVQSLEIPSENGPVAITISIGIARMSTQMQDISGLVKAADRALYAAKNSGRNRVECA